ncbi:MAG: gliding motility-associated C-terminal domain-containing protein, partial [Flavobacteriales bacterium]
SGQNLQLDFQNDGTFDYSTSSPFESTSFTYINPGVYLAVATVTQDGCVVEDSVFIRVFTEPSLFIPNVITPNGDSKNNSFYIKGSGISGIELFIYNRWGALVGEVNDIDDIFEPTDSFQTWQPNEAETSGTYMYFYKAKGFEGQELEGTGTITVLGLE